MPAGTVPGSRPPAAWRRPLAGIGQSLRVGAGTRDHGLQRLHVRNQFGLVRRKSLCAQFSDRCIVRGGRCNRGRSCSGLNGGGGTGRRNRVGGGIGDLRCHLRKRHGRGLNGGDGLRVGNCQLKTAGLGERDRACHGSFRGSSRSVGGRIEGRGRLDFCRLGVGLRRLLQSGGLLRPRLDTRAAGKSRRHCERKERRAAQKPVHRHWVGSIFIRSSQRPKGHPIPIALTYCI